MKHVFKRITIYLVSVTIIAILVILYQFYKQDEAKAPDYPYFDMTEIRNRGYLIAAVERNSTDYYIYKGRPQGFQLDLLRKFTEKIKIPLRIIVENDYAKALDLLYRGKCDIVAHHIPIEKSLKENFSFSDPLFASDIMLIHNIKPDSGTPHPQSVLDLLGIPLHIPAKQFLINRLQNLSNEIGDSIITTITHDSGFDALFKSAAHRDITYTAAPSHLARLGASYYPQLTVAFPLSLSQNYAWVIRKNTPELRYLINNWISEVKNNNAFDAIFYKYFKSDRQVRVFKSDSCSINKNHISPFDEAIKRCSRIIEWDWRLLASLIYQESKFNNDTASHRGAFGVMQLMPITAQRFGVDSSSSSEDNIEAGVMYIKWLDKQLIQKVKRKSERIKFILAAYNVGLGHIFDAQALAAKHGKNPEVWDDNVDYFLLNKSKPFYRNDTLVRNGAIKGKETYALVIKVIERYHHYMNLISE